MVTIRTRLKTESTSTNFTTIPSISDLFGDIGTLSDSDLQKFQIQQQTALNTSAILQAYEEQQRAARESKEAYEKVLKDRKAAANRARLLVLEQNESQLKLANYRKEIAATNASTIVNNAFAQARAGMNDLKKGVRQTIVNRSGATALFAKGGVEVGKGSAALVVDNITREGFRQVDNNFKDSLNRVNNFLAQAFSLNFNAEMDVLATEEQNRLNVKITELNLS